MYDRVYMCGKCGHTCSYDGLSSEGNGSIRGRGVFDRVDDSMNLTFVEG